jgi:Uma2 family endonuclease
MLARSVNNTVQDYLALPESETERYELVEGELIAIPSNPVWHQHVSRNLLVSLHRFLQVHDLGELYTAPLDIVLSNETVLQPDLMFISRQRAKIIKENNIQGAPDLVVEVLSPSTAQKDRELKKNLYGRFGVREYWIVDPDTRSIQVYEAGDMGLDFIRAYPEGTSLHSPLLPELRLDVAEVFAQ